MPRPLTHKDCEITIVCYFKLFLHSFYTVYKICVSSFQIRSQEYWLRRRYFPKKLHKGSIIQNCADDDKDILKALIKLYLSVRRYDTRSDLTLGYAFYSLPILFRKLHHKNWKCRKKI